MGGQMSKALGKLVVSEVCSEGAPADKYREAVREQGDENIDVGSGRSGKDE